MNENLLIGLLIVETVVSIGAVFWGIGLKKKFKDVVHDMGVVDSSNIDTHNANMKLHDEVADLKIKNSDLATQLQIRSQSLTESFLELSKQQATISDLKNHDKMVGSLSAEAKYSLFRKIVNTTTSRNYLGNYHNVLMTQIDRQIDLGITSNNDEPTIDTKPLTDIEKRTELVKNTQNHNRSRTRKNRNLAGKKNNSSDNQDNTVKHSDDDKD